MAFTVNDRIVVKSNSTLLGEFGTISIVYDDGCSVSLDNYPGDPLFFKNTDIAPIESKFSYAESHIMELCREGRKAVLPAYYVNQS